MSAISEYVLRCAYIYKQTGSVHKQGNHSFHDLLQKRIRAHRDFKNREILQFEPRTASDEGSAEQLAQCLEDSINVAHDAVIEGAKIAARKYGRRETNGRGELDFQYPLEPPRGTEALVSSDKYTYCFGHR